MTAMTFIAMYVAANVMMLEGVELVTVTFLTLAFAQLWHVFNMIEPGQSLLSNDLIRNKWVWMALALCSGMLLVALYVPLASEVLTLAAPSGAMWVLILGLSITPVLIRGIVERIGGAIRNPS